MKALAFIRIMIYNNLYKRIADFLKNITRRMISRGFEIKNIKIRLG